MMVIVVTKDEYKRVHDLNDFLMILNCQGLVPFIDCYNVISFTSHIWEKVEKMVVSYWVMVGWLIAVGHIRHAFILLLSRVRFCLASRECSVWSLIAGQVFGALLWLDLEPNIFIPFIIYNN